MCKDRNTFSILFYEIYNTASSTLDHKYDGKASQLH